MRRAPFAKIVLVAGIAAAKPAYAQSSFVRADVNDDATINITDPILLLNFLFVGGKEPDCLDAADADDSGNLNITDPIRILNWLFAGGEVPPSPSPPGKPTYGPEDCGVDPTPDNLPCRRSVPCADALDGDRDGVPDERDNCPERPNPGQEDADGDRVGDVCDNCPDFIDPLHGDLDLDGVGDVCDNCPTQQNPNQEDANADGAGDACEASPVFSHCGEPVTPEPGVARELFDPEFGHPAMQGIIHPVLQLTMAPMEAERRVFNGLKVQLNDAMAHNLFLASLPQGELDRVGALSFVRAVFPLPPGCRLGEEVPCPGLGYGRWLDLKPRESPESRSRFGMCEDPSRNLTVLFGGQGVPNAPPFGDTWTWDGNLWSRRETTRSPAARSDHAMALDPARGRVVLFGGLAVDIDVGGTVLSDETWLWDGAGWEFIVTARSPEPRRGHAMAYDPAKMVVLLFGGTAKDGTSLGDTWAWDGKEWQPLDPPNGPAPRTEHAMATDVQRAQVVLFGGEDAGRVAGDTWVWDGAAWTQRTPEVSPERRAFHAMAAQDFGCGVLLTGGMGENQNLLPGTWFWNGEEWSLVGTPAEPRPRADHGLSFESSRRRVLLFGGRLGVEPLGDTWELEESHIMEVIFHRDVPTPVAGGILAAHGSSVLQQGTVIGGTKVVNTWEAAVPRSEASALAMEEPVVHAQFVGRTADFNDGIRTAIGVNAGQGAPWCGGGGCTGAGVVIAQWETRWAPGDPAGPGLPGGLGTHVALVGRTLVRDQNPLLAPAAPGGCVGNIQCNLCTYSHHAAHTAGTMIGDGTGNPLMIGMAPASTIISYDASLTMPVAVQSCELTDSAVNFGARLANNSWGNPTGTASQAQYDAFSQGYDQQVVGAPQQAIFFSAGNLQQFRVTGGGALPAIYAGPSTGGACLVPPPGVAAPPAIAEPAALVRNRFFTISAGRGQSAKNTLVIGAVNSGFPGTPANTGSMTTFSGWGPTQDGRIKPDLVAPGAENNTRDLVGAATDPDPGITSTSCGACSGNCLNVNNAYGACVGTSMSCPAATGSAALIMSQQLLTGPGPNDTALDSDSLKALLIHTATDLQVHFPLGGAFMTLQNCGASASDCWPAPVVAPGTVQDGPDYVNGWGLVDVLSALQKLTAGNVAATLQPTGCPSNVAYPQLPFNSPLGVGGDPASIGIAGCSTTSIWDWVVYINVPAGTTQLKVTIAWDDPASPPPGAGATGSLLVNDLDLIVTPGTGMGGSFSPTGPHNYSWWLDPSCPYRQAVPVAVNAWDPATYADHRNNVEQVIVNAPAAGQWRIVVQSIGLPTPQPFGICISTPPSVR